MTARLNPYLVFRNQARAAMEFYRDVFGGELRVDTFGKFGDPDAPTADLILHSVLETPSGFTLMGGDLPPDVEYQPPGSVSISLSGPGSTDGDELRRYWQRLSDGGTVTVPFAKQPWGDEFGMCTDKFGVHWMVNVGAD
jgi:PhnB protein